MSAEFIDLLQRLNGNTLTFLCQRGLTRVKILTWYSCHCEFKCMTLKALLHLDLCVSSLPWVQWATVCIYRSFCAWRLSNRCYPRLPSQQLHEASGVAQHSPFEPNNTTGEIIASKYFKCTFNDTWLFVKTWLFFLWNFAQAICNDLRFWFPISLSSCQRSTCPDTYVSMRVATLLLKNRLPPHGTYHTVRRWSVWFAFNFKPMPLKAMGLQELGLELPRILGSNVNCALCHLGSKDLARSMSLNISSPNQDAAPNCHI